MGNGGWGVHLIQEIRGIAGRKFATAWTLVSSVILFLTPLLAWYFSGHLGGEVPAQDKPIMSLLPYAVFFTLAALLLLSWLFSHTRGDPWQDVDTVHYWWSPYSPDSRLLDLSALAQTEFGGDTMNAAVVKYAVSSGCAAGVRVTNDAGQSVGFCDVFRLHKYAMSKWLDGTLSEPELKDADFEPLSNHEGDQKTLELIVGAILIDRETRKEAPSLAFQVAEAAQGYFWNACAGWDEIRLYSSIFSRQGQGLASLYGFSRSIYMQHRHGEGTKHDVWVRTLRRSDPPRIIRGLGGRHTVILEMKHG